MDAHTDQGFGNDFGYGDFTDDGSDDRNTIFNDGSKKQEHTEETKDENNDHDIIEESKQSDDGHLNDEETLRKLLHNEQRASQQTDDNHDAKSNNQLREDLLRAQIHDSIPQKNENVDNGNIGDSNERPIKEIRDKVEQLKNVHSAHDKPQEQERREKVKMSKLIFAGKKNGKFLLNV